MDGVHVRPRGPSHAGVCRPRPRAAVRYRLHEQQSHTLADGGRGGDEVEHEVAGLATRPATHIRVLHLTHAFLDGLRRALGAPALLGGVYLVTLLAGVPLTLALHHAIVSHLGVSVAADAMAGGVNWEWWEEFSAGSSGFERTFTPSVIGFAAVLSNLSALVDGTGLQGAIAAVVVCYLAVWAFLVGGLLDRLARRRRVTSAEFFSACGTYFFPILPSCCVRGPGVLGVVRRAPGMAAR